MNRNDYYFSFPIRYSSFIEDLKVKRNSNEMISEFFRYKADAWLYEKEWRYITQEVNVEIDLPGNLSGIYFGMKTSKDNDKRIFNILGDSVRYYEAQKKQNRYEVDYVEVKPQDIT